MAKIFRLHTEGINTIQGWGDSTKYGTNVIDQIADPNGASATKEITSIPSPFARMDLVKTAFKTVAEGNIDGDTIFHKMVSDSLDVGQVFFQYEKFRNQVEILVWDKQNDLNALLNSPVQGHHLLGETYRLFLQQDAATYNFDRMQRLYILNYMQGPNMMDILGATSPATLFFTPANDLSFAQTLRNGADILFDNQYTPLYQRDIEYQKYWYLLRMTIPDFSTFFPEVNSYLDSNFRKLDQNQQGIIRNLTVNNINDYDDLSAAGAGNIVEVLGFGLKKQKNDTRFISEQSGFVIQPTVIQAANSLSPLVLPIETLAKAGNQPIYTINPWDKDTKVPFVETRPLEQRTLPGEGSKYPYLTIGDFLEDTIIHIPYEMNANCYFNGNLDATDNNSYLLPIKSLFFNYFTPEDLMNKKMGDGKSMFEMQKLSNGVGVYLRIPIKNEYIEYHRIYGNQADVERNRGAVTDVDFSFGIFPNVKFNDAKDAYYRIGLISSFKESDNYDVCCISDNQPIHVTPILRNNNYQKYNRCKTYVVEHANIDYCEIAYQQKKGVIIPKLSKQEETDQYTFAIDFGTTNTHIEYNSVNNKSSKAFDITAKDECQMPLLAHMQTNTLAQYMFDFDFLPEEVGGNSEFRFPIRTALSEGKNTNWDSACPMADANIPFPYEKRIGYEYNKIITGLKWSNDIDAIKKVRCYIETLFLILRNKVLLNKGNLSQTKIVWFYPISMTAHRFNLFEQVWQESYKKYFGDDITNIIPITESIAPYQYYKGVNPNVNNIVTIDIGGGTSDIVIANGGNVQYITSFRFAANSIFGDAGASPTGTALNGIIRHFYDQIIKLLTGNYHSINNLSSICQQIKDKNISSDIASFLFSLKDNKDIAKNRLGDSVDFDALLRTDGKYKIVFIFFYAAIIYHLAHIMKAKKLNMPRHIAFSGNGSKVISILTPSRAILENYTKLIFEKIYATTYNTDGLTLLLNDKPKEATCKGGIINPAAQDYAQIDATKVVLKSSDNVSFISNETYSQIDDNYKKQTIGSVKNFIQFVLDLNQQFSYTKNFGLEQSSLAIAKGECFKDLDTYMDNGLQQKLSETSVNDPIEETFFFYPINGMLHALCAAICDNQ